MCISSESACVRVGDDATVTAEGGSLAARLMTRLLSLRRPERDPGVERAAAVVRATLQDYRVLAHDDGEGRPLRYMSLYGGIVTKML